ncbi:MAG: hypothetical protein ABIP74_03355, partial [Candidatus Saccharimonas sp.]
MRRIITSFLLIVLAFGSSIAYAEDTAATLTDSDLANIRANCVGVQATLNRIRESDTLARVNLVQQYETISTKLMAPLNSRVALNRLNGVALTQTTVEFNNKLDEFRSLYQQYKETLSRAIDLKCTDQPVTFYDTLNLARDHRAALREAVIQMTGLVKQYSSEVDALQSAVKE